MRIGEERKEWFGWVLREVYSKRDILGLMVGKCKWGEQEVKGYIYSGVG